MIIKMPSTHGREGLEPTSLVIHAIGEYIRLEGEDVYAPRFLRSRGESAHVFITPSGEKIMSRSYNQVAWHARAQGYNFKSIGMEIMVPGAHTWDTFREAIQDDWVREIQYNTAVEAAKEIINLYPINEIVEHSAIDPENKVDPGPAFPWALFNSDVGFKP
jgi:N-acetyl-anhydromuramyl-L-alanine amidase AmpD